MKRDEKLSKLRQSLLRLDEDRRRVYEVIFGRERMLKGSLIEVYKVCGKKGCRCTRGERHGPFKYLSISKQNKTTMIFIRKADELWVKELQRNYKNFRRARSKILKFNAEITKVIDKIERLRAVVYR